MLQRIYTHNFRCLENFEFKPGDNSSALLIGKNGSGKSTLRAVLAIFQGIGRGVNRVGELVKPTDFTLGRSAVPMRFQLDVKRESHVFSYTLALELPERFRELRVLEERLVMDGEMLFSREHALVTVYRGSADRTEARFNIDWHMVALPVIQNPVAAGALGLFRDWLAGVVLLAPIPKLMSGDAAGGTQEPDEDAANWADWLSGLLDRYPSAYSTLSQHLKQVMPDLADFRFERTGKEAKSLLVRFKSDQGQHELPSSDLSDGEKCFFLCAVVLAANQCDGPLFTFWDEPDNYLSLGEVSQFVMALRRGFHQGGQILMTSHNAEAIRRFSDNSTWVLGRRSHLEPSVIRQLQELAPTPDLIQKLIDGDLDPWA
jgi:ATPase subunit of ABC transporter with duplicated ATPase domains